MTDIRRSEISDLPRQPLVPGAPIETAKGEAPSPAVIVTRGTDRTIYDVLVDGSTDVHRVAAIRRDQAAPQPSGRALPTLVTRPDRAAPDKPVSADNAPEVVTPR